LSERTPADLAHAWRDALVSRDATAFGALFAPGALFLDVEHRTADLAATRPIQGRATIEAMCRQWLDETPTFEYEVDEVLSDGRQAAVRWRYAVQGVALDGVSWLACAGGTIHEARVYFDSLGLYRGLGRV
jgi:hypothetical protein